MSASSREQSSVGWRSDLVCEENPLDRKILSSRLVYPSIEAAPPFAPSAKGGIHEAECPRHDGCPTHRALCDVWASPRSRHRAALARVDHRTSTAPKPENLVPSPQGKPRPSIAHLVKPHLAPQKPPKPFRSLPLSTVYLHVCMANNILFAHHSLPPNMKSLNEILARTSCAI